MATGRIILPATAWFPPDTDVLQALLDFRTAVGGTPVHRFPRQAFDASANDVYLITGFRVPDDYASSPVFKFDWMVDDTNGSNTAGWGLAALPIAAGELILSSNVYGSPDTPDDDTSATTANVLIQASITMSTPTINPGEWLNLALVATASGQNVANIPYFLGGILEYTTT